MASNKQFLEYVLEQLSLVDGVTYKPMMGEFILYVHGKIFGGIYDDRLLVKPMASVKNMLPEAPLALPYDGAKEMVLIEDVDDRDVLTRLVITMEDDLPAPKRK